MGIPNVHSLDVYASKAYDGGLGRIVLIKCQRLWVIQIIMWTTNVPFFSLSFYVSATATACSVHDRRYIIYTFFFSLRSQKSREYLKYQEWSIHATHEKSNRENSMEDWGGPRIIAKQMETFTRPQGLVRFLKMIMSTHGEVSNPNTFWSNIYK